MNNTDDNSFGKRFRAQRRRLGLTQIEFLKDFNEKYGHSFTPSAISQYEHGKRTPEVSALLDFADYFGVSVDYLLAIDPPPRPTPQPEPQPQPKPQQKNAFSIDSTDYRDITEYLLAKLLLPKLTAPSDGELEENVVIFHRNGQTGRRKLTKEQMDMLIGMLNAIPEEPKDL